MKIIKKEKPWSAEVECTGAGYDSRNGKNKRIPCHSILEVEGQDIYSDFERCSLVGSYVIMCPCCKSFTEVDAKVVKMPESIMSYAQFHNINDLENSMDDDTFGV